MKSLLLLFALSINAATADLPKNLSKAVLAKTTTAADKLRAFSDCVFLVQVYHPTDASENQLGLCLYDLTLERGIFAATTCVGVLIEPDTGTRNAFYGKKGHWGIEGKCDAERLKKKFEEPSVLTTVNPLTSLAIKKQEGRNLRVLKDDFGLWPTFEASVAKVKKLER